jgi:hypothetical protein
VHWAERGRNILWFRTYSEDHFFRLVNQAYDVAGFPQLPVLVGDDGPVSAAEVAARLVKNVEIAAWTLSRVAARYAFVLQPTLPVEPKRLTQREHQVLKKREQRKEDQRYFQRCYRAIDAGLQRIHAANFTYRSLVDVFAEQPPRSEIYIDSYHYGDRGNKIVADALVAVLRDDLVVAARARRAPAAGSGREEPVQQDSKQGGQRP